jgi:predicted GH43/DUF377 family glycosyl hydrolase
MGWNVGGDVFPPSTDADVSLEAGRAVGPSVLETDDGTLRMWYAGHDGSTSRILHAVQRPGRPWQRLGIAVDPGLTGPSDSYGVESPSVVATGDGYLMAYAGSDGVDTRLHLASSTDGAVWKPLGPFLPPEPDDAATATDPCLLTTASEWWLFYSGYDGSRPGRASILAAVSGSATSWDRVGVVLEPDDGERAVSEPSVVTSRRRFLMFFVSDDDRPSTIQMATSHDGVTWNRRGIVLPGSGEEVDTLCERSPCAVRLHDHTLRLWFAGRPISDREAGYRIWSAAFTGSEDWLMEA